jgi:hypothetical protein
MSRWIAATAMLGTLAAASACGTEDKPAVCDSVAAVQSSVDHVQDANVSENGLTQLRTDLDQLKRDLQQLTADAQAQFATQAAAVKASAQVFTGSLTTARSAPDAANLSAVRTAITGLQSSVQQLSESVKSTC